MSYLKTITVALILIPCLSPPAEALGNGIAIDTDYTFASKYIWRGFDVYDDHTASQPSVNLDLFESGFGFNVWQSRANGSGFENLEEFDYTLYYANTLFDEQWYQADYCLTWVYFDYVDAPTRPNDLQEGGVTLSFPNALPGGLVPSYNVARLWAARSESPTLNGIGGWIHLLSLACDWTPSTSWGFKQDQTISLFADLTYNDGYGGAGVDHDWSHGTLGASTSFDLAENVTFTPALYYQISIDDSVNDDNELWCTLSMSLSL